MLNRILFYIQSVFLILLFCSFAKAQTTDCFNCDPLAEVSVTNKGLCKILEISLKENFRALNSVIKKRAGFRDLVIDRSNCKTQTIAQAYEEKKKQAEEDKKQTEDKKQPQKKKLPAISNFSFNKLELELVTPLDCENLSTKFKVKLKKIDVTGNLKVDYTDKNEDFIPSTQLQLTNTENSDVTLTAEAFVDPKTGQLNDLVFLAEDKMHINVSPGSLHLDMNFKKAFASHEQEIALNSKYYRQQMVAMQKKINSPQYIDQQIDKMIDDATFKQWARAVSADKNIKQAEVRKTVEADMMSGYGSRDKLRQKLLDLAWPDMTDDKQIFEFMKNPPKEINFFPDVSDRIDGAHIAAVAENAGFSSKQGFEAAVLGVYAANQMQGESYVTKDMIEPLLKKEMVPLIEHQVNQDLRNLKNYWKHISEVPSLNLENIKNLDKLKRRYRDPQLPDSEKSSLVEEIRKQEIAVEKDWMPIDTAVIFDQNTRGQKLLRAQIVNTRPECSNYPRKFSDNADENFDIRTEIAPNTLQEYFDRMTEKKKLNICIEATNPQNCEGGTEININKPPKITCENGKLIIAFEASAQKSIFGVDAVGQVKAELNNCDGSPCIQFSDAKGRFKNGFINTFFGSVLERSFSAAVNSSGNRPISVPQTKLKNFKTDPSNCKTKLDWDIQPD